MDHSEEPRGCRVSLLQHRLSTSAEALRSVGCNVRNPPAPPEVYRHAERPFCDTTLISGYTNQMCRSKSAAPEAAMCYLLNNWWSWHQPSETGGITPESLTCSSKCRRVTRHLLGPPSPPPASQRCKCQTDTWAADTVAHFAYPPPLSPPLPRVAFAGQRRSSHLICACTLLPFLCYQHKSLKVLLARLFFFSVFFFFFFFFFFSPSAFDTQCLSTHFSPCHGSRCQHTERPALLHEWSSRWRDQRGDGDR